MEQKRGLVEIIFMKRHRPHFTIHVNLHAMESLLIFNEMNFVEVPKILEIHKIYDPQKKSALRYFLLQSCIIQLRMYHIRTYVHMQLYHIIHYGFMCTPIMFSHMHVHMYVYESQQVRSYITI